MFASAVLCLGLSVYSTGAGRRYHDKSFGVRKLSGGSLSQDLRFDGRAAIAADAGSGGVDQGHKKFLTAIVLAGAGLT